MTDRERLIEILNVPIHPRLDVDPLEAVADYLLDNGVTFAKDTNVPSWIPVSERLPQNGEIALCRLIFNELRILQWDNVSKWWLGYGAGDDWSQKDVTHWMPLPEPPKEEING